MLTTMKKEDLSRDGLKATPSVETRIITATNFRIAKGLLILTTNYLEKEAQIRVLTTCNNNSCYNSNSSRRQQSTATSNYFNNNCNYINIFQQQHQQQQQQQQQIEAKYAELLDVNSDLRKKVSEKDGQNAKLQQTTSTTTRSKQYNNIASNNNSNSS